MSGFRWRSHSPSRHSSPAGSTRPGRAGRGRGPGPRSRLRLLPRPDSHRLERGADGSRGPASQLGELAGELAPLFDVKLSGEADYTAILDKASKRLLEIEQWMEDIPSKGRDEHYDGFVFRAALDA